MIFPAPRVVRPQKTHVQLVLAFVVIGEHVAILLARRGQMIQAFVLRIFEGYHGVYKRFGAVAANANIDAVRGGKRCFTLEIFPVGGYGAVVKNFVVHAHIYLCGSSVLRAAIAVYYGFARKFRGELSHRVRADNRAHCPAVHACSAAAPHTVKRHFFVLSFAVHIIPAVIALLVFERVAVARAGGFVSHLFEGLRIFRSVKRFVIEVDFVFFRFASRHKCTSP